MNLLSVLVGFVGGYEWILIILVVVLLFGGRKIPELMKGLGKGMKEFKNATKDEEASSKDKDAIDK
ncbi:twin-arginine translocase TatA/TatE family subunit [Prolixibacteraceae bacterium JC049]|nr:twin-arginine translocase TatA/TatE family subunit [Prolixibacteraceae bacterium JC049]